MKFDFKMQIILIQLTFFIAIDCSSQEYIPMNFLDGIWVETYFKHGGYEEKIQKFCKGDTTIDDMVFYKLFELKVVFSPPGYLPDTLEENILGLIGNSTDRTVKFIPKYEDIPTVIYDFNIDIGDTIQGDLDDFVVNEIDSIEVCGIMHKRYIQTADEPFLESLVEGVGFSNGLLGFYDVFESGGETVKSLECYSEKNNQDCSECSYIIGISNEVLRLKIYPNPVDNLFHIHSPHTITSIQIFNLIGNEVYIKNFDFDESSVIEIGHLSPGIYIIRASFDDASEFSSTIVKN